MSTLVKAHSAKGNDLVVEFVNGTTYTYEGAASEQPKLAEAPSKGQYFNSNIKGKYSFSRN
tara:strand:+ start:405 stop:587 length:183 start_codon:yes stop_codon:yes gene_type:complete